MALMRYEPWSLVSQLQDEINRVFSSMTNADSSAATAAWVPAVDIHEFGDRFELYVDLPGVDPESVDITLDDGVLTISGIEARRRRKATRRSDPVASADTDVSIAGSFFPTRSTPTV